MRAVVGDVTGKNILLFDDEIATGGSLLEAVASLEKLEVDFKAIYVGATHGVLSKDAVPRIADSRITQVAITNTVPLPEDKCCPKIVQLSVAPLFGEAIRRIHTGESVSMIFE